MAAAGGSAEAVALLLEAGADIAASGSDGSTPLTAAAAMGHPEAARLLLDRGAAVEGAGTGDGRTPLMMACHDGHAEVAELLLQASVLCSLAGAPHMALNHFVPSMHARAQCMGRQPAALHKKPPLPSPPASLQRGANVQALNKRGQSALMYAAEGGSLPCAAALLAAGARVDVAMPGTAITPLLLAAMHSRADIVEALLGGCSPGMRAERAGPGLPHGMCFCWLTCLAACPCCPASQPMMHVHAAGGGR